MIPVKVFANGERCYFSGGSPRDDNRKFLFEIDGALENKFIAGAFSPNFFKVIWPLDQALAFPVVTERGTFQDGRRFDFLAGACEIGRASHRAIRSDRDRRCREKIFFAQAILGGVQDGAGGADLAFG